MADLEGYSRQKTFSLFDPVFHVGHGQRFRQRRFVDQHEFVEIGVLRFLDRSPRICCTQIAIKRSRAVSVLH